MNKKDFIITAVIAVLSVALIVVVILSKKNDQNDAPTTPSSSVAHDHNGDGIPDHDDSYHNSANGDAVVEDDLDIGLDIENVPTESGSGTQSGSGTGTGTGGGAVEGGEIDMDDLIDAGKN